MRSLLALLAVVLVKVAMAAEPPPKSFKITAQPVASALKAFAAQSDLQLIYTESDVSGVQAAGVSGMRSPREALAELLRGTGLVFEFTANNVVVVRKAVVVTPAAANTQDLPDQTAGAAPGEPVLEEVVVTAQKRVERLVDVPVPVTVLQPSSLLESNRVRLQDFYQGVPGLSLVQSSGGDSYLAIRGISTGAGNGNPPVGITVDDIPYGSSVGLAGGGPAPDIDPSELASLEILRGPQGTLYGASSIGGLIKYSTVDPSTTAVSGGVQASVENVQNGPEPGFGVRGAVNLPVSANVAMRASGFVRQDPGYIDNIATGRDGINKVNVAGGRLAAMWKPSDTWSFKVSALLQHAKSDGSADIDPSLGDLEQALLLETGKYDKRVQLYSATLSVKLGAIQLTSLSGYGVTDIFESLDATSGYTPYTQPLFGVAGSSLLNHTITRKFSQELRLEGPLWSRVDWQLGVFYTHESSSYDQYILGVDPLNGANAGTFLHAVFPTTYQEYAAFADATLRLTERFDIQIGGRESENRQSYAEVDTGAYAAAFEVADPTINPQVSTKANAFTFLITPRFRVTSELMAYARIASGYRPGGPNPTCTPFDLPCFFKPDKTVNYELGVKGDLWGQRLQFDTSLYYISWKDIQLAVVNPISFAGYYTNGGRAKSQGLESSLRWQPLAGLEASVWGAWNTAVLTEPLPSLSAVFGDPGDRLPGSSRFSGGISLEASHMLPSGQTAFAGTDFNYVGDRLGTFASVYGAPTRQDLASYGRLDARVGLRGERWTANIYGTNLANTRGVIAGGLGTYIPSQSYFQYIQPRTLGLSVTQSF